jgi:hypothetical protein
MGCLLVDAAVVVVAALVLVALLVVAVAPPPVALLVVVLVLLLPHAATPTTVHRTAATNPTRDPLRRMLFYLPLLASSNGTIPVTGIPGLVW